MSGAVLVMLSAVLVAQPSDDAMLAARVLHLFEETCVECHGPDLAKPKGDFGFITDLVRLSQDELYIVPGDPDNSELYLQMEYGEMPPPKSKYGKAKPEQIALVKQWVAAGAPAPTTEAVAAVREQTPPVKGVDAPASPQPTGSRLLSWIGRLHPATVHFPIALLISAAMFELWMMISRRREMAVVVRCCVWVGAVGAIVAAALGWLHADYAGFSDETVSNHRMIGIIAAAWGVLSVIVIERHHRRAGGSRTLVRLAVLIGALLVAVAGHLGGLITYGPHHYDW